MNMTEQKETVIRMEGIRKCYRLGAIGGRTLQEDLQSWWAAKTGKEDPNLPLTADVRQTGKLFMALNGIDLTVCRGERLGIIGSNGAGKSTLLKLLSRITAPTEGEIDIWGRVSSLLEIGTGFHGELTGRENIYMNGAILGMTKAEIDSKLDRIIAFSEVEAFIDTPVKRYSSGMLVKLAFSVAAFLDSEILVMDEVLAVGDMAFQRKCLDRMREAADRENRTILYVSHNMETIRKLCSRCVVMEQGKIIYDGDTEQAIAVYMSHNLGEDPVSIDLRGKAAAASPVLSLEHLTLLGKLTNTCDPEECLRMKLTVKTEDRQDGLLLRLTFRTETDTGIGTAWSAPFSLPEKGRHDIIFSVPLHLFAKGNFFVSLGLYRADDIGRKQEIEHVTRAFRIEIPGLPNWNTTGLGYMSFREIAVEEIFSSRGDMPKKGSVKIQNSESEKAEP